jgi:hypothetical protein
MSERAAPPPGRFHCPRAAAAPFFCVRGLGSTKCIYCARPLPLEHPTEISTRADREGKQLPIAAAVLEQWRIDAEIDARGALPDLHAVRLLEAIAEIERLKAAFVPRPKG